MEQIDCHWSDDGNDGINGINSGHARIYQWNNSSTGYQLGNDIDGEACRMMSQVTQSRSLLQMEQPLLAIGAYSNDGNSAPILVTLESIDWTGL